MARKMFLRSSFLSSLPGIHDMGERGVVVSLLAVSAALPKVGKDRQLLNGAAVEAFSCFEHRSAKYLNHAESGVSTLIA